MRYKIFNKFLRFTNKYKVSRGMLSYGILWPTASLIEQTISENRGDKGYDWKRCMRYSAFGFFFMGPTLYPWVRLLSMMYPQKTIRMSFWKAILEQICYEPFSITAFLFFVSRMEGKSTPAAIYEVRQRFFDAYRVAIFFWPVVQTINFAMVPVKNQVVFSSVFSLFWSTFLAFVKGKPKPNIYIEEEEEEEEDDDADSEEDENTKA